MAVEREIVQSPMVQGVDEEVAYTLTTTPWGSSPTSVAVTVWDITDGGRTDVLATVMSPNSPSVTDDVITLSILKDVTASKKYRVEVKFTSFGNVFEPYCIIYGEE